MGCDLELEREEEILGVTHYAILFLSFLFANGFRMKNSQEKRLANKTSYPPKQRIKKWHNVGPERKDEEKRKKETLQASLQRKSLDTCSPVSFCLFLRGYTVYGSLPFFLLTFRTSFSWGYLLRGCPAFIQWIISKL